MAKAHMETPVVANKAAKSKSTKKSWIRGASKPTESRCIDQTTLRVKRPVEERSDRPRRSRVWK